MSSSTPRNTQPTCSSCGSLDVTAPTMFSPDEGSARVHWKERASGAMFSAVVHRASVCLSCGHVALSLDAQQLEKVRRAVGGLVAIG